MTDIHKTVIQLVVLSPGPILPDQGEDSNWLKDIADAIYEGDSIGDWVITSTEVVPRHRVSDELIAIHGDGGFFDMELEGDA